MQHTKLSDTDRLHLAYAYTEKWHRGIFVPVNVSAVSHLRGISDKIRHHYRGKGCEEAVIAACLYRGIGDSGLAKRSLLNDATLQAIDGDNTMETIAFLFGRGVGGIVSELNTEPVQCPAVKVAEWAYFLSQPAQAVVLAKNWQSFEDRVQKINDGDTAMRQIYYCTNRFKIINSIRGACPALAEPAKVCGRRLLDDANAYLKANGSYRGRD